MSEIKTPYEAIDIIEITGTEDEDEYIAAWQYLIDTGIVWSLQGSYGRNAAALIEAGVCHE